MARFLSPRLHLLRIVQGRRSDAIAQWQQYIAMDPNSENAVKIRWGLDDGQSKNFQPAWVPKTIAIIKLRIFFPGA